MNPRGIITGAALLSLLGLPGLARAEGSAQTGDNQCLATQTTLKVDVSAGEVINLAARKFSMSPYPGVAGTGNITAVITRPSGQVDSVQLSSGNGLLASSVSTTPAVIAAPYRYTATEAGVHEINFGSSVLPFDVSVTPDATVAVYPAAPYGNRGRLFSKSWYFDAGTFSSAGSTSANFYVVTPGGVGNENMVWLLDFEGLAGYVYNVAGNDLGLNSPYARSSRPGSTGATLTAQHDVFVNLPITARGVQTTPALSFVGVAGKGMTIQGSGGVFRFESNVAGTHQVIIDTNRDGSFDPTSADAVIGGSTVVGDNDVTWDGKDRAGNVVAASAQGYQARLLLRIGEFHFAGWDIETARPGLAISSVDPGSGAVSPATMYWDDRAVLTGNASDDPSPSETILDGVSSASQRHAWGNFHSAGPGNNAFIDTWVFGAESGQTTSLMIYAPSADTDGDGVSNTLDPYPCDSTKSASLYIPGQDQMGLVLYEDKWPARGDLDFNDLAVGYNYEIILNGAGLATAVVASFTPLAIGAGYRSGLGLVLPVSAQSVTSVTRKVGNARPAAHPFQAEGNKVLVDVSQNTREFFDVAPGFINTEASGTVYTPRSVAVRIELNPPASIDTAQAPFDLFLFRSETPSIEVHLPGYAGTSRLDQALFGTQEDGSAPGRWFVNKQGLPYALHVPVATLYPLEQRSIDKLFPSISTFAASAGAQATDFYQSGVQTAFGFTSGRNNQPRPSPQVLPRGEVVSGACGG